MSPCLILLKSINSVFAIAAVPDCTADNILPYATRLKPEMVEMFDFLVGLMDLKWKINNHTSLPAWYRITNNISINETRF